MSDVSPNQPAAKSPMVRRLQIALAVSAALNLLVAGTVAGAMLGRGAGPDRGEISRELGFGPFSGALGKEERDALRSYLQQNAPQLRAANTQRGREIAAVQAALRAQPFSPDTLRAALADMQQRQAGQLQLGYAAIADVLIKMPDAQRRALADRLQHSVRKGGAGSHSGK